MIKRRDNSNFGYCRLGFYIDISMAYFNIDGFETLFNDLHEKYGANEGEEKGYFKNLDDAENCLRELNLEKFEPQFIMEKLLGD